MSEYRKRPDDDLVEPLFGAFAEHTPPPPAARRGWIAPGLVAFLLALALLWWLAR
jgi:hypothetical protein